MGGVARRKGGGSVREHGLSTMSPLAALVRAFAPSAWLWEHQVGGGGGGGGGGAAAANAAAHRSPGRSRPQPGSRRPASPAGQRRRSAPRRGRWSTCAQVEMCRGGPSCKWVARERRAKVAGPPGRCPRHALAAPRTVACLAPLRRAAPSPPADVALLRDARLDGPPVLVAVEGVDGHDVRGGLVACNCRAGCRGYVADVQVCHALNTPAEPTQDSRGE